MTHTAVWFRNDLRIHDHAPLTQALQEAKRTGGTVQAFYLYSAEQLRGHSVGHTRFSAIETALNELQQSLNRLGIQLTVMRSKSWQKGAHDIAQACRNENVSSLHFHYEPGWDELQRDRALAAAAGDAITITRHHDLFLLAPDSLLNGQGGVYQVFSAYKRALMKRLAGEIDAPLPAPVSDNSPFPTQPMVKLTDMPWTNPLQLPITESQTHERIEQFMPRVPRYHAERDLPAMAATSRLSVALSLGTVSCRQLVHDLLANGYSLNDNSWFNEIVWRDFYQYLLYHRPELCLGKAFKPMRDGFPWSTNKTLLERWQQGNTGVPIVDAAMRQLNSTGWMHNRLRMISAMYLVKILQIDWRLGERYFAEKLADFNFAANNGGWQWVASTGADAVPYFRIFNPTLQSKKFDPNGVFIRKYVGELAELSDKQIHQPTNQDRARCHYPTELVDYALARADTLQQFNLLNSRAAALAD